MSVLSPPSPRARLRRRELACLVALALALAAGRAQAAGSDRTAFIQAEAARRQLERSASAQRSRAEWNRVIRMYRQLVHDHPRSGYADNALLAIGDLCHEVAKRFDRPGYDDEAVKAYRMVVSEYPTSRHGERALYSAYQIERGVSRSRGTAAARLFLRHYPRSDRAGGVQAYLEDREKPAARTASSGPLVDVENLRFWSGDLSTRVVLDLAGQVPVKYDRLRNPERLYVDLIGTRLSESLTDRAFPVGDGLLDRVRIAQNRPSAVRVVLDFKTVRDHSIFYLANPARLVIDVHGDEDSRPRRVTPPAPAREPTSAPAAAEASASVAAEGPEPAQAEPAEAERRADAGSPPPAPSSPEANSSGSYSIARQLGLGARRIVIDPGHGGHDPGSIGPNGLREKDVVLDVAKRLEKLIRTELGADVVMTRSTDVFIPLEERTAIANSEGADLFLSIHANSARSRNARGVETYYLSFAADKHAEEVAARENAISRATLKDLQDLVKAITLNSKIDESRDFAASVHQAMVDEIRPHYSQLRDRGVRTAPFYVLIGANMPSILAELAFISNPYEERQLKESAHRQLVASSLLRGVSSYLEALNRNQTRQLTATATASRVDGGKGGR